MHIIVQLAILLGLAVSALCSSVVELNSDNFNYVERGTWLIELYVTQLHSFPQNHICFVNFG